VEATPLHGVGGKSDLYNGVDAQTVFPHFSERGSFVDPVLLKFFMVMGSSPLKMVVPNLHKLALL
jgi:hypothetical protein